MPHASSDEARSFFSNARSSASEETRGRTSVIMNDIFHVDPAKIAMLKQKLVESTVFREILDYFFTHLGEDLFTRAGTPIHDAPLMRVVARTAALLVRAKSLTIVAATTLRAAEHRLVFGTLSFGKWTGLMFYFEDLERGFLALGDNRGPSLFTRFSLTALPSPKRTDLH